MNGVLIAVVIIAVVVVIGVIVAAAKGKTSHNAAVLPGKEEVPAASEPKSGPDSGTSELFCKKCGAKLRKNDVFCVECGQKVE